MSVDAECVRMRARRARGPRRRRRARLDHLVRVIPEDVTVAFAARSQPHILEG